MNISKSGPFRISNRAYHPYKQRRIISIDMDTKRGEVCIGSNGNIPCVILFKSEGTCYENKKAKCEATEITFPEFKGWNICLAEISKYTLFVGFIK